MLNWKKWILGSADKKSSQAALADPIREAELDRKLNAVNQQFVAQAVKRLPEEDVSMAWRSDLNTKLMAIADQGRKKRTRAAWIWRPTAGLVGACALAAAIGLPRATTPIAVDTPSYALEQEVAGAHLSAENATVLVGAPVNVAELPSAPTDEYDFVPIDLETL